MGILSSDVLIKTMIEAAFRDYRRNMWIVEDVFSSLIEDSLANVEAGQKEVRAATDWFTRTELPVLMQHRIADSPQIPCISIAYEPSREMEERASLGDVGCVEDFVPDGEPIKCSEDFTPSQYDSADGKVTVPSEISTKLIVSGQYFVSAKSGNTYEILEVGPDYFKIKEGVTDDFTDAYISPKYAVWQVKKELTFHAESFSIGCHTSGDPATTIWLHKLVLYALMRYKETHLEARGYELSTWRNSALERNREMSADNVFSKYITLNGQTEISWIKMAAPRLEIVTGGMTIADGGKSPPGTFDGTAEECPPTWQMPEDEF